MGNKISKTRKICLFATLGVLLGCVMLTTAKYGVKKYRERMPVMYLQRMILSPDTENVDGESTELVQRILGDIYGKKPQIQEDMEVDQAKIIYLGGEKMAEERGLCMDGITENGYLIAHGISNVYLFAKSQTGFTRGIFRISDYAEENGRYLGDESIMADSGLDIPSDILVGSRPIEEYKIVISSHKKQALEAARLLQRYIAESSGRCLEITEKQGDYPTLTLISDAKTGDEPISIDGGEIIIQGQSWEECIEHIQLFANCYLGWAFAGEEREHVLSHAGVLNITDRSYHVEGEPWMLEREPIICLWKTNVARGEFYSPNASLKSELLSYSDDQLYEYIKMMKYMGFTGIQVTDMCSAWAAYGGYEYVQDRLRYMADVAHSLDMKFTLWVWGAEFEGYGWVDNTVSYYDKSISDFAYENPRAIETFQKYYSIYAQLADCSDRVIMHFNDPGNLVTQEDIAYFAGMFRDMVKSINPLLDFGVSCYT
nr:hypothetical protein [Acetatifactor sp.]